MALGTWLLLAVILLLPPASVAGLVAWTRRLSTGVGAPRFAVRERHRPWHRGDVGVTPIAKMPERRWPNRLASARTRHMSVRPRAIPLRHLGILVCVINLGCSASSTDLLLTPGCETACDAATEAQPIPPDGTPADSTMSDAPVVTTDATATNTVDASDSGRCNDPSLPPLWADCSGRCAPDAVGDAAPGTCGSGGGNNLVCPSYPSDGIKPVIIPPDDITIRTPDHAVPGCAIGCAPGAATTAAVVFRANLAEPRSIVQVSEPWHVTVKTPLPYDPDSGLDPYPVQCFPPPSSSADTCAQIQNGLVIVWTAAPNPPATDIVIRKGLSCP